MNRRRRLPPMNGIRALEAAARHLSFTRAAGELNVTPAAVSQQIKRLENRLGVELFTRVNNHLELTDAGKAWLPKVMHAFDLLESGISRMQSEVKEGPLVCRLPLSFSILWLAQRLERFQLHCPKVDLRLVPMKQSEDDDGLEADIEIRNGVGGWPGMDCILLLREQVFPVCSPALHKGPPGITSIQDLQRHTLLHVNDGRETWDHWFAAAGHPELIPRRHGLHFDQSVTAVQAAVNGLGVALGRSALVAGEIAAGRLVPLFDVKLPAEDAYWIVCRKEKKERPGVRAFRDWLLAEAAGES